MFEEKQVRSFWLSTDNSVVTPSLQVKSVGVILESTLSFTTHK